VSVQSTAALLTLKAREGATIGELAALEWLSRPAATRMVDHLEALGMVARGPDINDGRQTLVTLTRAGRAHATKELRRRDAWLEPRLARLTVAERTTLTLALSILRDLTEPQE
jgi:DNA-binding MarR family transcriptional regulator